MATKKERKQRPDDGPSDGSKRKKKKQKLHQASAEAAEAEDYEVADNVRAKHDKQKKKKKEKKKQRRQDGDVAKGKRGGLITDERFAAAHWDPRFQRMPKHESKVTIDSRFAEMLSDPSFAESSSRIDKRGKPRQSGKPVNPLLHYYLQQDDEDNDLAGIAKAEKVAEVSDEDEKPSGPGSDADFSSPTEDDDEDDEEDDQNSVNSDIVGYLMATHEDTPMIEHGQETHRLAVVNMDWINIKADDLYVVMSSCLPKGGQILSVAVYPTEFGLKCMEIEEVRGPYALIQDKEEHSDDDSEIDDEKLRTYELNKLRYYYAVVVCDSSATANYIYNTLNGTELLTTSNVFDLRFIPDSMEFKHPPHDITTEAPTNYKEPDFQTHALQNSKVKLTWDEDEPRRRKILRQKFDANQLDELNQYLASSSGESDGGENDDGASKKRIDKETLLSLLQSEDDSDDNHSDDTDMEITFSTGLEDLSKHLQKKKDKKSESVWESSLRKRSEKRKAKKNWSKHSSDDDSSDYNDQETPDQPDDFFVEEPVSTDAKATSINGKDKSKKLGKSSWKGREKSPERNKEQEASVAELELLFAEDQRADQGPKDYKLKSKKAKGKKGKEMLLEDKLPKVNSKDDPRFSAILSSPGYALDPTDPQFKRSAAYLRQRAQKKGLFASDDAAPDKDEDLHRMSSAEKERRDFSSTIRSLKRNSSMQRKDPKGR